MDLPESGQANQKAFLQTGLALCQLCQLSRAVLQALCQLCQLRRAVPQALCQLCQLSRAVPQAFCQLCHVVPQAEPVLVAAARLAPPVLDTLPQQRCGQ